MVTDGRAVGLPVSPSTLCLAQPAAPAPLPNGYMRAPAVPVGLAPKMRVTETTAAAHVFDANFSAGDEIMSGLTDLVIKHNITSGYVTGLGGLSGALLGLGDPEVGAFKMIPVDEKCELDLAARPHRSA